MTSAATQWAWANSRAANGSLIVLLAIADEIDSTGNCIMSVAELTRKTRLSDRGVRNGIAELVRLGELEALSGGTGRGNRTAYGLPGNPAESATFSPETRQNLPPLNLAESATFSEPPPSSPQVSANPAESATFEISDVLIGTTGSYKAGVKDVPAKPPRPDVDRLCEHLASRIEANGSNRPAIGKKWRDAARLMLDKDGRTEEQAHAAIDWCQDDEFWRGNILSMPKLREHYERLRLDAIRKRNSASRKTRQQETDDLFADARELARQLDAQEAGNDPRRNGHAHPVRQGALPPAGR